MGLGSIEVADDDPAKAPWNPLVDELVAGLGGVEGSRFDAADWERRARAVFDRPRSGLALLWQLSSFAHFLEQRTDNPQWAAAVIDAATRLAVDMGAKIVADPPATLRRRAELLSAQVGLPAGVLAAKTPKSEPASARKELP